MVAVEPALGLSTTTVEVVVVLSMARVLSYLIYVQVNVCERTQIIEMQVAAIRERMSH